MFLRVIEVARHHLAIPSGASQHDRTLNNPQDVTCQRPCVYAPSRTMLLDGGVQIGFELDRKSTRLNSSHGYISYAVFCLKKKKKKYELYCNARDYRLYICHDSGSVDRY